jgi:hypothetical protein
MIIIHVREFLGRQSTRRELGKKMVSRSYLDTFMALLSLIWT